MKRKRPQVEDPRRRLPSVDRLLRTPQAERWVRMWGRAPVVEALREALGGARLQEDEATRAAQRMEVAALLADARERLDGLARPRLRRVLNGTGVVLHTNLGRAPLASEAVNSVGRVAAGYSNLEYEVRAGRRGSRYDHCADLICTLTGAEAALVVNNNAAAVALTINELARGREVIVSRGELVEIGGSFRIPEIIERAGGHLVEVGTTNRTRIEDYRRAITPSCGVLLKVHRSNYRLEGFVSEASVEDLVALGNEAAIPVVHDLGSGLLLPECGEDLRQEPHPRRSVDAGVEIATWSGDKLLGGPQAGVIHGRAAFVARLRGNPLLRAFRVDKLTLAALEATLRLYGDPEMARARVPTLRMIAEPASSVEARALAAVEALPEHARGLVSVGPMTSVVGGGALPGSELPSAGWVVDSPWTARLEEACRQCIPPLVGRIEEDRFLVDFRTILPGEEPEVASVLASAVRGCEAREASDGWRPEL